MCRILAIAPYEGMKNMIVNLCADKPDILLTALVGDLDEGARLAKTFSSDDFDIILSRGGTAELIRKVTSIPVLDIAISSYDVLNAIRIADSYQGKYAIVAYPSIAGMATLLCDVLQSEIPIYTVCSRESLHENIDALKAEGTTLIIGDTVTAAYARQCSLDAILITSGVESMEATLKQALYIHELLSVQYMKEAFLRRITQVDGNYYAILSEDGTYCWQNPFLTENRVLSHHIQSLIPIESSAEPHVFTHRIGGDSYSISCERVAIQGVNRYFISASKLPQVTEDSTSFISVYNYEDLSQHYFKNYMNSSLRDSIEKYSAVDTPILILGETGTAKDKVANALYCNSTRHGRPLYVIDCAAAAARSWNQLLNQSNSILYYQHNTIYFKNTACLSEIEVNRLITCIGLNRSNRYIFSLVGNEGITQTAIFRRVEREEFIHLRLPPLRERINEIPTLAALYINQYNMQYSKQVIGVMPDGMEILQGYFWPGNIDQFKRVIMELVISSKSPYIAFSAVQASLRKEKEIFAGTAVPPDRFDINRSLDDIVYDVVCQSMTANGMNQTKVAKILGISRTTLWRILRRKKSL